MPGYDQDIKTNTKFLKIEAGDPRDVRLLNPEPIERYVHIYKPPTPSVPCAGDDCRDCIKGDEPKQHFLANVYDHTRGKVLIWEYGTMIAKQLKEIYKTLLEEDRNITDTDLKVTATGSQMAKRYQITPRMKSQKVPAGLVLHDLLGDGRVLETGEDSTPE